MSTEGNLFHTKDMLKAAIVTGFSMKGVNMKHQTALKQFVITIFLTSLRFFPSFL